MFIPFEFTDIREGIEVGMFQVGDNVLFSGLPGKIVGDLGPSSWLVQLDNEPTTDPIPVYESEMVKYTKES